MVPLEGDKDNLAPHSLFKQFCFYAAQGDNNLLRQFLSWGLPPDLLHGTKGNTALIYAIQNRHPSTQTLLLESGASLQIRNADGFTPQNILNQQKENEEQMLRTIFDDTLAIMPTDKAFSLEDNPYN